MSSRAYSARLTPEPRLRLAVLRCGHALAALGAVLIFQLPFEPHYLFLASSSWIAAVLLQNRRLRRAWYYVMSIRLYPDGRIELLNRDQGTETASLASGSVLFGRVGWLRIQRADGSAFAELVSGHSRRCNNWRRLQVIWRHIGAL